MSEENKLKCGDISDEKLRSYTIYSLAGSIIHKIEFPFPKKVFYGSGHAFHRVLDGVGAVTLAPAPGFIWGECGDICGYCELSWIPQNIEDPCQW